MWHNVNPDVFFQTYNLINKVKFITHIMRYSSLSTGPDRGFESRNMS
jgi:hypothetical protein